MRDKNLKYQNKNQRVTIRPRLKNLKLFQNLHLISKKILINFYTFIESRI